MGMNGIFMRFRLQQILSNPQSTQEDSSTKVSLEEDNEKIAKELAGINSKLESGDMSALKELDKFKITYTSSEQSGTTTIEYDYNGTHYRITCKDSSNENLQLHDYLNIYKINQPINVVIKPVHIQTTPEINGVIQNEESEKTEFSKNVVDAINSQDMHTIMNALDNLGISYVKTHDTSKNYQNAFIIKFIYDGEEFNIPCEDKSIESNTQIIDNSIEAQLDNIVKRLKTGNTDSLEDLKGLGIEYKLQNVGDDGFIVTFSYNGKDYVAARDFASEELTYAINNGDIDAITQSLNKLGISYVESKDTSKNYQNAFIIKFIYEGEEFNIPCEDKSIESNTQIIDNSIEAQLDNIVKRLKTGNTDSLEDLKGIGIEYKLQNVGDDGFIVTFSYNGKDYIAARGFASEELTYAINNRDIDAITQTLNKLGISYVESKDTSKNYQNAYIIKFIYEGEEFNIPCEYKSIESNTQIIDNSVEAQLDNIVKRLKAGNTDSLEDLKRMGIEYKLQNIGDEGYIVTFSYDDKDYVAAYMQDSNIETSSRGQLSPNDKDFVEQTINKSLNLFS